MKNLIASLVLASVALSAAVAGAQETKSAKPLPENFCKVVKTVWDADGTMHQKVVCELPGQK